jgi:hypothetical protein
VPSYWLRRLAAPAVNLLAKGDGGGGGRRHPRTMTTDLPPSFFLYISSRNSAADPYSGFILVDATLQANNVWKLAERPRIYGAVWTIGKLQFDITSSIYKGHYSVVSVEGTTLGKKFNTITTGNGTPLTVMSDESPVQTYPVLEMVRHTPVFGSTQIRRNVGLQWIPNPTPGTPIAPNVIAHVPSPAKKKATPAAGTLNLFVAKQLLDFAQSKHEMCPITAEEFITGETAVMPCGHLFMRMAIEETFKKESNKCPACRQLGSPTYC